MLPPVPTDYTMHHHPAYDTDVRTARRFAYIFVRREPSEAADVSLLRAHGFSEHDVGSLIVLVRRRNRAPRRARPAESRRLSARPACCDRLAGLADRPALIPGDAGLIDAAESGVGNLVADQVFDLVEGPAAVAEQRIALDPRAGGDGARAGCEGSCANGTGCATRDPGAPVASRAA